MKESKRQLADAYADWLLTPREMREPPTQRQFAELYEISEQSLRNYRKEPVFQRRMQDKARGLVRSESLPDIIGTLYRQATDAENPRSVAAAKLLLDFAEKAAGDTPAIDPSELTDEELVNVALAMLHKAGVQTRVG